MLAEHVALTVGGLGFRDVFIDDVPHFEDEEPGIDYFEPLREAEYDGPEVPLDGKVGDMLPGAKG